MKKENCTKSLNRHEYLKNIIKEVQNIVRSYFLYKRSRGSDLNTEEIFGERLDTICKVNDEWKIASRTIYPDQAVLTVKNLSMFL